MSGELKTQLVVGADVSGAVAGVETTKKKLATLGPAAVAAGKEAAAGLAAVGEGGKSSSVKVDAASKNMIGSIQRQIAVMEAGSKSGADYYRALANQRGIDVAPLKPYLDQLDAVAAKQKMAQAAIQSVTPVVERVGVSAAQTAAALRGVPAQFTDIVTSIQGGQAPLTVFLQQGGQLKDMFGGAGPAARALGGYVLGLVNPFTVAAAAAGVLALAYYQGSQEAKNYTKALILSGNAAGTTTSQLQEMASAISAGNRSITQGAAANALAVLAQTGAVGASSLQQYAAAVVDWERVTGVTVAKTAEAFKDLEKSPLDASVKLNAEIRHLTSSTFEHIKSLEEQGKYTDAARAAQDAYASALSSRAAQITQNLGFIETAWRGVIDGAKRGWDAMLGIGRAQTGGEQLESLRKELAAREARGPLNSTPEVAASYAKGNDALRSQITYMERLNDSLGRQAVLQGEAAKKVESRIRWEKDGDQYLSNREKRELAITKARNEGAAAGASQKEIDARIKDINDKLKDPKTKAYADDGGVKYLETLRQQTAALQEQLTSAGKMTDAEREQAKFAQLIADLKGKTHLTAEQKGLVAAQDRIRAQLSINVGLEREVGFQKILADDTKRRADALKATENAMAGIGRSIELAAVQQREQYDDRLSVLGLGSQAAEQLQSREQIQRQYARFQKNLTDEAAKNRNLETAAYLEGSAQIEASLARALDANSNYYAALKERQLDWSLGAKQAFENYVDDSNNAYRQGERFASTSFTGIEDMMISLRKTGKLSFRSISDAWLDELIRMETRTAMSSLYKAFGGGGGAAGGLASILGGLSGGFSTSTAASLASGLGGSDVLGSFLKLASYDGGGYTGDSNRTGGVDGKGGFMAIMHPRETVTDHTRPNSRGSSPFALPNIINQTTGRVDQVEYRDTPQGPTLTLREISAQLDNPNSDLSRSMKRNINAPRRR